MVTCTGRSDMGPLGQAESVISDQWSVHGDRLTKSMTPR